MKPRTILSICLAFATCAPVIAAELQPAEAGARPLRARLVALRSESRTLRTALAAPDRTAAEYAEIAKRLVALDVEEKQILSELEGVKDLSRSPYVTYAKPPSEIQ